MKTENNKKQILLFLFKSNSWQTLFKISGFFCPKWRFQHQRVPAYTHYLLWPTSCHHVFQNTFFTICCSLYQNDGRTCLLPPKLNTGWRSKTKKELTWSQRAYRLRINQETSENRQLARGLMRRLWSELQTFD